MGPTRLRVLLVEDDADLRAILSEQLEDAGFHTDLAANGQQALSRLTQGNRLPDVILSNYTMPELDGGELLYEVRGDARLHDIPVIIMTAGLTEDHSLLDADAVLHKPLDIDELTDAIERVLRRRQVSASMRATSAAESAQPP